MFLHCCTALHLFNKMPTLG